MPSPLPRAVALGACALAIACGAGQRPASDPSPDPQASTADPAGETGETSGARESSAPPTTVAETSHADVLSEICPGVSSRPQGTHADALAMELALTPLRDLGEVRALLCASGT